MAIMRSNIAQRVKGQLWRRGLSTHQAIVASSFGPPEVLKLETVARPAPSSGQVLVKMYAAGVNPSDTYVRLGPHGPWAATPHLLPSPPFTPGKDGAGIVEEIGGGVSGLAVGERVYTTGSVSGTSAEFAVCNADTVWPLPARVSFAQGACVGVPCATAYRALVLRCAAKSGEAVFIHGASGAVGLAATQLAAGMGCTVIGTAGTAAGEAAIAALGATPVNHRTNDYLESAKAALPAHTDGLFDVVLEMAAHANLLADVSVLRHAGRVAIIGSKPLPIEFNPRLLMPKEISVHGVFLPASPCVPD